MRLDTEVVGTQTKKFAPRSRMLDEASHNYEETYLMRARTGIFMNVSPGLKVLIPALIILISAPSMVATVRGQKSAIDEPPRGEQRSSTRRVFVRSKSLLVRSAVVEDKLLKRAEFRQLGFSITRDESDADIILELRHDLLTK